MCVLRVRPSHSPLRVGRGALFPPNAACINKRTIPSQLANKRGDPSLLPTATTMVVDPQHRPELAGEDLFLRYQQQLQLPMSPSISHPMSPLFPLLAAPKPPP